MVWVVVTVLLNVTAQVVLKGAAIQSRSVETAMAHWWQFGIALAAYGVSVVTWVLALRELPLSVAYPFMAIAFVLVPVASIFLFNESVTVWQWCFLGLLIVAVIGFAVTSAPAATGTVDT